MNESILSYYPSYSILDEILSGGNYDSVNIYMDLKKIRIWMHIDVYRGTVEKPLHT